MARSFFWFFSKRPMSDPLDGVMDLCYIGGDGINNNCAM